MTKFFHLTIPVFFLIVFNFANLENSVAFSIVQPQLNKISSPGAPTPKYLRASEFIKLSATEFTNLTGKKLNLFERLSFAFTKMRLKHDLKKNPDLKITDYIREPKHKGSFNFSWFMLGFAGPILGLLTGALIFFILLAISPVVIAYATKQDKEKIKSVWLGFGLGALILVLLVAILIASFAVV
jgi:hypothetical protein